MIANDQLIAYMSGALVPTERERLEEQLAGDETALRSVVEQERLDAALRAMFSGAAEREQVKQAILEVVCGTSYQDIKSSVMHEIAAPRFSFRDWLAGWRGALAGGLAAAACAALAFLLWPRPETVSPIQFAQLSSVRNAVVVVRDGGELAAKDGAALQPGDAIRVGDGAATVVFADQTRLVLAERTELKFSGDGRQIELNAGRLAARVAKQPADRPLTIRTPLAVARVIGTEFTLDAAPRATRIEVSEGLVKMAHAGVDSAVEVAGGEFAVAVPQAELIAGLLPSVERISKSVSVGVDRGDRDFARQPFAADSPWNRRIGSGAAYSDVQSPALDLAGHGAVVLPASHERPVWIARPGNPEARVVSRYDDQVFATVPAPADALRGAGRMVNGTIIDAGHAVAYELVQAVRRGGDIEVMLCLRHDLRGTGVPPAQNGHTFSGLPLVAGIIREGELERGISHALSVAALHAGLSRRGPDGQPFVWPARHTPIELKKIEMMGATGNVCYGTLLAIPRGVDIAQLGVGNSGPAFEIARALQTYGAYVTHSYPAAPGGMGDWKQPHLQLFADLPERTDFQKLAAEVSRLARHLKVVSNNGPAIGK